MVRRWLVWLAIAGCGGAPESAVPQQPVKRLAPAGPPLPPPPLVDAKVRGATYLTALASQIQPAWGQFLEDCRTRLPKTHPLNDPSLHAVADIVVLRDGKIADVKIAQGSGNGDFDTAVFDILGDASPVTPPTTDLESDDEKVHVRWLFARDRRQAGPQNGQIVTFELPILGVVERHLAAGNLNKAALRVATVATSDPDRVAAAERVMIATLREGLQRGNGAVRRQVIEAIGRGAVQSLANDVHALAASSSDTDLQLAAIAASAQLADPAVADQLLANLAADLDIRPQVAIAKTSTLVQLGRGPDAAVIIRAELESPTPQLAAFGALGLAPVSELAPRLPAWFKRGDASMRAAVCTALPAAAPELASSIIANGMRDADATVRMSCVEALGRGARASAKAARAVAGSIGRLRELARDRDRTVRARAVSVLALVDPGGRASRRVLLDDPSPEVRLAMVVGASELELRTFANDRDPDVRAAAFIALADRLPGVAQRAASDVAFQVRLAAVGILSDDDMLERLTRDDSPEVASAALIRLAGRRGRAASATPLLARLATSPAAGPERARIAQAWLLAR